MKREKFLPVTRQDMEERGITRPDFVYVIGDAYVDHPSFGPAILSRLLERRGFSVCILAQPDWRDPLSVTLFGEPRLGFLVSAGNTIRSPGREGRMMLTVRAGRWGFVRTGRRWYTAI